MGLLGTIIVGSVAGKRAARREIERLDRERERREARERRRDEREQGRQEDAALWSLFTGVPETHDG